MENLVIAVGSAKCGGSPVMPYVGRRFDGAQFTEAARYLTAAALLRCGFDVMDISTHALEPQDAAMRVNRHGADGAVILGYAAFGSGKTFNDVHGCTVRYSPGRFAQRSRVLCEDVCAKLMYGGGVCGTAADGAYGAMACPVVVVDAGYLTCFDEAKRVCDPDFAVEVAEHVAMGLCEHYGVPFVKRDDIRAYPMLCTAATGKRGKKIKMLQALLGANGRTLDLDGVFGKNTDAAVRGFIADNGLVCTDGANAAVWRDLLLLAAPDLERGSRHNAVMYVQRKLLSKLYKCTCSGVLDEPTETAMNEYLCDIGMPGLCRESRISRDAIVRLAPIGGGKPRLF